jgi:hypothetical protein
MLSSAQGAQENCALQPQHERYRRNVSNVFDCCPHNVDNALGYPVRCIAASYKRATARALDIGFEEELSGWQEVVSTASEQANEVNNPLTPKITLILQDQWTPELYGTDADTNAILLRECVNSHEMALTLGVCVTIAKLMRRDAVSARLAATEELLSGGESQGSIEK